MRYVFRVRRKPEEVGAGGAGGDPGGRAEARVPGGGPPRPAGTPDPRRRTPQTSATSHRNVW